MHASTSRPTFDWTDSAASIISLRLSQSLKIRRLSHSKLLHTLSESPEQPREHVEMDFMKLFGTVIAVLFHPGSASKLNGKNLRTKRRFNDVYCCLLYLWGKTSTCLCSPIKFLFKVRVQRGSSPCICPRHILYSCFVSRLIAELR